MGGKEEVDYKKELYCGGVHDDVLLVSQVNDQSVSFEKVRVRRCTV